MNPLKLVNPLYLFEFDPGRSFKYYLILTIFFAAITLCGFLLKRYIRLKKDSALKKTLKKYPMRCYKLGILGLFLLLMRHQSIPLLSMRILLLATIIGVIIIVGRGIYAYRKQYPTEQKRIENELNKKKYMRA